MIVKNNVYLVSEQDLSYLFRTLLGKEIESVELAAAQCNVSVTPAGDAAIFQIRPFRSLDCEDSWMTVSKRAFDAIAADPTSGCCQRIVYTCSGLVLTNTRKQAA